MPIARYRSLGAPPSSRGTLSPSLLALLNHFIHIEGWAYVEERPILQGRMLRHELNGMIHVPRLKHESARVFALHFLQHEVGRVFRSLAIGYGKSKRMQVYPFKQRLAFTEENRS
jgi:hypothetical protein